MMASFGMLIKLFAQLSALRIEIKSGYNCLIGERPKSKTGSGIIIHFNFPFVKDGNKSSVPARKKNALKKMYNQKSKKQRKNYFFFFESIGPGISFIIFSTPIISRNNNRNKNHNRSARAINYCCQRYQQAQVHKRFLINGRERNIFL